MVYAPTAIDLSRLPAPNAIEPLDYEALFSSFKARFLSYWSNLRTQNPNLPEYTTTSLETEAVGIVGEAWSYLRLLDRQRVNDGIRALLAPLAAGTNLDSIVASRNIQRLVMIPASSGVAAVMEGDESLLRRYLYSFDVPAAGSEGRYLHDAFAAWPQSQDKSLGLWDARVNGRAVHGRRGDTDVVLIGPFGRLPTVSELAVVRNAITNVNRSPEAVAISVMSATRAEYSVSLVLDVPGVGPSAETIRTEAEARVRAAAKERAIIGGEIPDGLLAGAAYGAGVIKVLDLSPVAISADPYKVPVMTALNITTAVRG
ncbi:baseplate assembly protein [Rhizobiales bacterium RZME27]|uniref:Baseplate assembly protein n=1 Tax=Endobacterium cereale TaxID=2663029 RepID=A0A6A8A267_9HYPH|nr:baseplate J/gp47 family protein [Endobacterium cereale]MQY44504.1 baseplate assembly protein [Endobacterium cereale]